MNPEELHYTQSHEWVRIDGEIGTIGITDHAQKELGEIVYLELPENGHVYNADEEFGTVESVKAVSELYAPVSGSVTAVNEELNTTPEKINTEPHSAWMIKVKIKDKGELASLLSSDDYEKFVAEEGK